MRTTVAIALVGILAGAAAAAWRFGEERTAWSDIGGITMKLISPAFGQDEDIPAKYSCDGEGLNPPLSISGVPEGAKSLALIVDDPDAVGGTWVHWTAWNVPPATSAFAEGWRPPSGAVEGVTSFGRPGYGGPCPPSGTHRYFFKIFALDAMLDLPPDADAGDLERAMAGHILDKAGLVGLYGR